MNINEIIHGSPLFFEISDDEIEYIMKLCFIREYKRGDYIFKEKEDSDRLLLVLQGKVSLHKSIKDNRIHLDEISAGDLFGTTALSDDHSANHDAICEKDAHLLEIDFTAIEKLYNKNSKLFGILMLNIVRLLSKRLFRANDAIYNIAELSQHFADSSALESSAVAPKPICYVIEDDPDVRSMMVSSLEYSFDVHSFVNPTEVMGLIEDKKLPDIFVSDFLMPEMTGIEFTEFLKEEKIDIPIIFVTGVNRFDMAAGALNLGVHSLVEKPFSGKHLVQTVKRALREKLLVEFNRELLGQYMGLFNTLSAIMQGFDKQSFVVQLKNLVILTQAEYQKINEKRKYIALLE